MGKLFTTKIQKNCRKFYKRMYDFERPLTAQFVDGLAVFGYLKIYHFSTIVPTAKDVFSVKGNEGLEISGAINDKSILLVIPKNNPKQFELFEQLLSDFLA